MTKSFIFLPSILCFIMYCHSAIAADKDKSGTQSTFLEIALNQGEKFTMNDAKHNAFLSASRNYAQADRLLNATWKELKSSVPQEEYKKILADQRVWVSRERDAIARRYGASLSEVDAYTQTMQDRIKKLRGYLSSPKESFEDPFADAADEEPASAPGNVAANVKLSPESAVALRKNDASRDNGAAGAQAEASPTASKDANAASAKKIQVVAEGSGRSKIEALQAAWMEAVRNAVGMFMTSKTESVDDKLTEQVAMYSRGQINSYTVLSEDNKNGVWNIKIRANVDKDILEETIQPSTQRNILSFDGQDIAASHASREQKKQSAADVIKSSSELLDFRKCFDYTCELKSIKNKNGDTQFLLKHILKINLKKYKAQSDQLEKIVSSVAEAKREVPLDSVDAVKRFFSIFKVKEKDFLVEVSNALNLWHGEAHFALRKSVHDNEFCFVKNVSTAICYRLPVDTRALRQNEIYTVNFFAENGKAEPDDFESTLAKSDDFRVFFSGRFNKELLRPSFAWYRESPVLVYTQLLDLSTEQLVEIKNITGRYSLSKEF